jgi:hypothetical protein
VIAAITFGAVSTGVTAAVAVVAFIVGGIVRPRARDVAARRREAESLSIATALRNQSIDERLSRLLTMAEVHERRITTLEHERLLEHPGATE